MLINVHIEHVQIVIVHQVLFHSMMIFVMNFVVVQIYAILFHYVYTIIFILSYLYCLFILIAFLSETHGVSTKRSTPSSAPPSTAPPAPAVTTPKNSPPAHEIYIVNEVVNDEHVFSSSGDVQENHDDDLLVNKGGAKGKHSWDDTITWHRVSYGTGFGNRIVSMSKLIILVMPIFIALLF